MDIEKLAREAGLVIDTVYEDWHSGGLDGVAKEDLRRFAALVVEECAKVAKGARHLPNDGGVFADGWCSASVQIEQAIRMLAAQVPPESEVSDR